MSKLHSLMMFGLLSMIAAGYFFLTTGAASAQPAPASTEAEPAPPADQQYVGVKKCAACHFDQFMKWKPTKHATSFNLLPAEYQSNATCLACHTTGFGQPTGFKTAADADLKGTTCEACHGPGSSHAELAQTLVNQQPTPEQQKSLRDSIWKVQPHNVCVACHQVQGHHDSATPPALRKP